jgi:hypothetical protein
MEHTKVQSKHTPPLLAEIAELREGAKEIDRLREVNADLLAALEARAAIARAKGQGS